MARKGMAYVPFFQLFVTFLILNLTNYSFAHNIPKQCENPSFCFAIDESSSIRRSRFQVQKKSVQLFTRKVHNLYPASSFSAVGFSDVASSISPLTLDTDTFMSNLKSNRQSRGRTFIGTGLKGCVKVLQNSTDSSSQVIILLSDGLDPFVEFERQDESELGVDVAPGIKDEGLIIATVKVGKRRAHAKQAKSNMKRIASHKFLYTNLNKLKSFIFILSHYIDTTCAAAPSTPFPHVPTTTPSVSQTSPALQTASPSSTLIPSPSPSSSISASTTPITVSLTQSMAPSSFISLPSVLTSPTSSISIEPSTIISNAPSNSIEDNTPSTTPSMSSAKTFSAPRSSVTSLPTIEPSVTPTSSILQSPAASNSATSIPSMSNPSKPSVVPPSPSLIPITPSTSTLASPSSSVENDQPSPLPSFSSTQELPTPIISTASLPTIEPSNIPSPLPSIPTSPTPSIVIDTCNTIDVCFAIDETSSITAEQFSTQTEALIEITSTISGLSPLSRFSAVGFSSSSSTISEATSNLGNFISSLRSNVQSGGIASSGSGLLGCSTVLGLDNSVPRLIVLIMDGEDSIKPFGAEVAPLLKSSDFILATIGVGESAPIPMLRDIASVPRLFSNVSRFELLPNVVQNLVDPLCNLPPPADPSSTPTPSTSPAPFAPAAITSIEEIPAFDVNAPDSVHVETLRQNFEFFIGEGIGFNENIRVEGDLVTAESPLFPWNIIDQDGPRFLWPLQSPSNSPVVQETSVEETSVEERLISIRQNAPFFQCSAKQCAAEVTIYSQKFLRYVIINNAFKKLRKLPNFNQIFEKNRSKIKIIRRNRRKYSVFVPLLTNNNVI